MQLAHWMRHVARSPIRSFASLAAALVFVVPISTASETAHACIGDGAETISRRARFRVTDVDAPVHEFRLAFRGTSARQIANALVPLGGRAAVPPPPPAAPTGRRSSTRLFELMILADPPRASGPGLTVPLARDWALAVDGARRASDHREPSQRCNPLRYSDRVYGLTASFCWSF